MTLESIRAVILFAIGDPAFRAQLVERPEEALWPFDLSLDDRMLLGTVRFTETAARFDDLDLLEQLLGHGAGDGFPGFGASGWFGGPAGFGPGS